jgi:hypothetical protein
MEISAKALRTIRNFTVLHPGCGTIGAPVIAMRRVEMVAR